MGLVRKLLVRTVGRWLTHRRIRQARTESEAMEAARQAFRRRYPKLTSGQIDQTMNRLHDSSK